MEQSKKISRKVISVVLSLLMVLSCFSGMSLTAYADNTEELLTTLTFGGSSTYSETKSGVVSVTATNVTSYNDTYGWLFFDVGSLSVTAEEGYTINKCVFRQNNKQPITDTEAPFEIHFSDGCCTEDTNWDMDGVTSIEVYRYVTPTTVDVTGVSLNKTTTTLTVGDTETLTATVSPDGATDKTVTWSSSDTDVATVENGVVTAVGSGTANITVTATNGTDDTSDDKTATCAVTVNAAIVTSAVTLNVNGGTINSGNITEYTEGTGATLPTDVTKDGHQFGGWYDNAGLTGSPVTAISTSDTGNKEYWAKWTANPSSVSYSVVFKVVNGSWDDGTTADKIVTLTGNEGDTLKLTTEQIPAVGTKPNNGYKAGSWDVTPSTDTAITEATTYTYTYAQKDSINQTVTFKVVNGSWNDETTTDKTVTLTGYEGDTLKLAASQIPTVGTKPNDTYKAGSWDVTPSTDIAITAATTYTYTYVTKEAAVVTKAPEGKTLTYNGQEQALVTAGEATGGEMQYALGTKDAVTQPYITSIPTATSAGTYYVWYKVVGDKNHNDSEPACVEVTINKAKVTVTADDKTSKREAALKELTYKVDGKVAEGDDLGIKVTSNVKAAVAGKYVIKVSYTANANYDVTVVNGTYTVTDRITAKERTAGKNKINSAIKATVNKDGSVTAKWGAVANAEKFEIYANYCSKDNKFKKIKTVKGNVHSFDITKLNGKNLDQKKSVKIYVVAYRKVNGKYEKITQSVTLHLVGKKNTKYSNAKAITVKKDAFTLKVNKTAAIKPTLVLQNSKKKAVEHVAKFRYQSTNTAVATVDKNGKITAVGKGTCTIYIFANNGKLKSVKVTVK